MSAIRTINREQFQEQVLAAPKPVLVDFYADWCGPCQAMTPVLEAFEQTHSTLVDVVKVDIEAQPELATQFEVRSIPTLMLFQDGTVTRTLIGSQSRQALEQLLPQESQPQAPQPAPHS